jgi:hypothetical protein
LKPVKGKRERHEDIEQVNSTMGSQRDEVISMPKKMDPPASGVKLECAGKSG